MSQYINYIAWTVGIAIICVVQVSVIHTLPAIQSLVSLPLIGTLLLGIVRRSTTALVFATLVSSILDVYSSLPFGVFVAAYLASISVLFLMQKRVLKNFALHAVLINTFAALVGYHLVIMLLTSLFKRLQIAPLSEFVASEYVAVALQHSVVQVLLVATCFFIAQLLLRYAGRTTLHV